MGRWVTLDDDQHVYIGDKGEFQPRGPGTKPPPSAGISKAAPASEKERAAITVAKARGAESKPAAGPGQAREMARSQFKVAEKFRTGKMADAAMKARYAREDALKAKLGTSRPATSKPAAKAGEATVGAGKMVHQGYTKEGLAKFGPEGGKPESSRGEAFPNRTTRAIEHAKAAGKSKQRRK